MPKQAKNAVEPSLADHFDQIRVSPHMGFNSRWLPVENFNVYIRYFPRIDRPGDRERGASYWTLELGNFTPNVEKRNGERADLTDIFKKDPWLSRFHALLEEFEVFAKELNVPFSVTQITRGYGVEEILNARGYLSHDLYGSPETSFRFHPELVDVEFGDTMTIAEFKDLADHGGVIPSDGSGYFGTSKKMSYDHEPWETPSGVAEDLGFTHVHWFNK